MIQPKIKIVTHPYPEAKLQARLDYAKVTGGKLIERPYWFEFQPDKRQMFFDLFGCIGWPAEIKDSDNLLPGYVAVVGVLRPSDTMEHISPETANFLIMKEFESEHPELLLKACIDLREEFGYGEHPGLLDAWYGDPERFFTPVALFNERMARETGFSNKGITIIPPDDFYIPHIFDHYTRSLRSALIPGQTRLYFGTDNIILSRKIKSFKRDDPAVFAMGGLIHTLLSRCLWMDQKAETVFRTKD